jgi:co-chaperonin GroES (HSP10)
MKAGVNQVIVRVKKTKNNEIVTGIKDESGNPLILLKDTDFEPEKNAVIHGEVVSAPEKLSGVEATREYDGYPVRNGKYEFNILKYSDLPVEVLIGDTAYFHFHSLDDESFLYKEEGWLYFTVQYQQIFCAARNGIIVPIAGYILVEPFFGDDIEEFTIPEVATVLLPVAKTVRGKRSASNLITEITDAPRFLEGVVSHASDTIPFVDFNVKPGDRVIYSIDSDFENEIEGRNYYVMHIWDLIATNNAEAIHPVGPWVMIEADKVKELTESGLVLVQKKKPNPNTGTIIKTGNTVKEVSAGDSVYFEGASPNKTLIGGYLFIKEADILYKI